MNDKTDDGDDGSDTQTGDLSASSFGLDIEPSDLDLDPVDADADDLDLDPVDGDADDIVGDHAADRDGDVTQLEAAADHYAEAVARYWGTPEGEWWP